MQTVKQKFCPLCHELNAPNAAVCAHCSAPFEHARPPISAHPARPADASDLPPLLWTLICAFLAVWGLVAAGPLRALVGLLTHPYVLIAAAVAALILTGLYAAECVSREPASRALLSTRDTMAMAWTAAALLGSGQALKFILPPIPVITRYDMLPDDARGCRVEVFIRGQEGDELWGLTGLNRKNGKEVVGIVVRRSGGGSARLPTTQRTGRGECAIVRYHLMVQGKDIDQVDGPTP